MNKQCFYKKYDYRWRKSRMKRTVFFVVMIFTFMALCVSVDARDSKMAGKNDGSLVSESNPQPSPSPNKANAIEKGSQGINPIGESNPQPSPSPERLKKVKIKKLGKEVVGESNPQPSPSPRSIK
jgi:hypothetical protein